MPRQKRTFTLIELLVVVVIIGILATLLLPVLTRMKEMGRKASCIGNLKQIGSGYAMYTSQWDGYPWARYNPETGYNNGSWADFLPALNYQITGKSPNGDASAWSKIFYCPGAYCFKNTSVTYWMKMYCASNGGASASKTKYDLVNPSTKAAVWEGGTRTDMQAGASVEHPYLYLSGAGATGRVIWGTAYSATSYSENYYDLMKGRHAATVNILFHDGHVQNMTPHVPTDQYHFAKTKTGTTTAHWNGYNNMFNPFGR